MSNKNNNPQSKTVQISILLIVLIITIMGILYLIFGKEEKKAFFARNINDASYDCEDKINSKYGDRLVNMHFDNLSSRYEAHRHQYLIYYRISIREQYEGFIMIKDYLAKCAVWEKLGYVSDFQVLDI